MHFNISTLCALLCEIYDLPGLVKRFPENLKFFMYFMLSMANKEVLVFVDLTIFSRIKYENLESISPLTLNRIYILSL